MIAEIKRRQLDRFNLLLSMYARAEANLTINHRLSDIAEDLGIKFFDFNTDLEFLRKNNLIVVEEGYTAKLTEVGVEAIRQAFDKPNEPTKYFPPFNSI